MIPLPSGPKTSKRMPSPVPQPKRFIRASAKDLTLPSDRYDQKPPRRARHMQHGETRRQQHNRGAEIRLLQNQYERQRRHAEGDLQCQANTGRLARVNRTGAAATPRLSNRRRAEAREGCTGEIASLAKVSSCECSFCMSLMVNPLACSIHKPGHNSSNLRPTWT